MKAFFIKSIQLNDLEGNAVTLEIYQLENGGVVGIDTSFIETEMPVYSPFDKNLELNIIE